MDFGANKTPLEMIKEGAFWRYLFSFIPMLMKRGTESHGKNSIS